MQISVFSIIAATAGLECPVFIGELDDELFDDELVDEALAERVIRLLNRCGQADLDRLERIGYQLPSLSVGDYFTVQGVTWQVATFGVERVTGDPGRMLRSTLRLPGEPPL